MQPRRARRRGFTITEILIAATLSLGFAALIGQTVSSGIRLAADHTQRLSAETRAREAFRTTTMALRGAIPNAECVDRAGDPASTCGRVQTIGPSILDASPQSVMFFSYTEAGQSAATSPPDLVRVEYLPPATTGGGESGLFLRSSWSGPSNTTYTNGWPAQDSGCGSSGCPEYTSACPGPGCVQVRIGELNGSALANTSTCATPQKVIFRYFEADGTEIAPDGSCRIPNNRLAEIALVNIDVQVSYRSRGFDEQGQQETIPIRLNAAVSLPSVLYGVTR